MTLAVVQGCTGTVRLNRVQAVAAAKRIRNDDRGVVRPYKCRHCNLWHVGGTDDWVARAKIIRYRRRKAEAAAI